MSAMAHHLTESASRHLPPLIQIKARMPLLS
jgi:hypothetical protein